MEKTVNNTARRQQAINIVNKMSTTEKESWAAKLRTQGYIIKTDDDFISAYDAAYCGAGNMAGGVFALAAVIFIIYLLIQVFTAASH